MRIDCGVCVIRSYRHDDIDALVTHADNPNVARYMTSRFPSPYTVAEGRKWIGHCMDIDLPEENFAIEYKGRYAGGIGFRRLQLDYLYTAEFGYWLGEAVWGKGIATAAIRGFLPWVFENTNLERLQAHVFALNAASRRVLDKAGLTFEGTHRRHIFKDGTFYDGHLLAKLRSE
ncbi:MAG: GNAT family N-acetyltransferase [Candidatus Meridianibacter frigidus]|nr:MAG: GNAT family N-acetyltransferase [Candidatus Eremiobacteraeota bacterium]